MGFSGRNLGKQKKIKRPSAVKRNDGNEIDCQQSNASQADRETLYSMAKKRLELGTTNKSEVLQMELSLLNAKVNANSNRITLDDAKYNLFSYLRVTDYEQAELLPPSNVPNVTVSMDDVLQKAIENSSHTREQRLEMLNASKALATWCRLCVTCV